jgi:hypothetical protein
VAMWPKRGSRAVVALEVARQAGIRYRICIGAPPAMPHFSSAVAPDTAARAITTAVMTACSVGALKAEVAAGLGNVPRRNAGFPQQSWDFTRRMW